jgi:hypothetical protein
MKNVPKSIRVLQDMGIILSRKEHGRHHLAPYEGQSIGSTQTLLSLRRLEYNVYNLTGNKPNTWKQDPEMEMLSYSLYQKND